MLFFENNRLYPKKWFLICGNLLLQVIDTGLRSRILPIPGEIFLSEKWDNNSEFTLLYMINETVLCDAHLTKESSVWGQGGSKSYLNTF